MTSESIDADLLDLARTRAAFAGPTPGAVVSDLIRLGLAAERAELGGAPPGFPLFAAADDHLITNELVAAALGAR